MEHKGSKRLETERLILRKLKIEDAREVYKNWASDPDVAKFMRWNEHKSIEDTMLWLAEEEKNAKRKDYYTWGIQLKKTGKLIGSIGAFYREDENGRYEVGYGISKKYWNNGYTTEALRAVMDFLINEVGISKFMCMHAVENPASGAVMRKVGFEFAEDTYYESFDKKKKFASKKYYLDIEQAVELEEVV